MNDRCLRCFPLEHIVFPFCFFPEFQSSKIAADDQVGREGAEDVGARAGEEGAEIRVGGDCPTQDAGDDGGADGVEQ